MEKKITVVFAINDLTVAGAQRLYVDLLRSLGEEFELHLLTFFQFPYAADLYAHVPASVAVHRLSFGSFRDIPSWIETARLLWHIRPRAVISSLFFSNTVVRVSALFLRCQVIAVEHNTYTTQKTSAQIFVDRLLSHCTYKIVAVSQTVLEFTAKKEKIPKGKFELIPNGIDTERLQALVRQAGPIQKEKLILNVGRLTAQKNQLALVEAFAHFSKTHPHYRLRILGEGSLKESLAQRAQELGIAEKVELPGVFQNPIPHYLASEFLVSASRIEGFGLAVAEALCCGVPVLATRTAGPDEMIQDGVNGFFIRDTSVEAIAEGLQKMLSADLVGMGTRAPGSVARYDIRETAAAYRKLIYSLL